uniref:Uncharacterized protein n=1 Tax=Florenciella sp. virus SA2 TaxID=3240092 RepID=A0AB39JDT0_9VIRU
MDQNNIILIKKWLDLEKDIGNYSSKLRELRKEKRELNCKMVEIMKHLDIECFDCNSGQIIYSKNKVKKTLNQKTLHQLLNNYFMETSCPEEADKLCNFINENREIQTKEIVKLKKKKI